jgi:hypothetical protein
MLAFGSPPALVRVTIEPRLRLERGAVMAWRLVYVWRMA